MRTRFIARMGVLSAAAVLGFLPLTPASSAAEPPPVESFDYTSNMQPLAASLRAPQPASDINSDLGFWGTTAFQGTYEGFRIIDVTDPEDPSAILNYDDCKGNQGDILVWENILIRSWNSPASLNTNTVPPSLHTCDGEEVPLQAEGLHIFDISDPLDPQLETFVDLECGSHTATLVPDVANDRVLVYNSGSSATCPGIDIVEVPLADPSCAAFLRREPSGRSCHDTAVILGDAQLAACAGGDGLTVFSLGGARGGTLEDPSQLWTKSLQGVSIGHAATFSWDGSILAFGHEPGGGVQPECEAQDDPVKKTLFFFNSVDGTELGRWVLPRPQTAQENCTIHNFNTVPTASRNILVAGNYQAGISVVDFTNPAQPQEIAYADPAPLQPEADGGDWSTYWYNGIIYESDIYRGLITWKLNDPAVSGAQSLPHSNPQTQEFTISFTGQVDTTRCLGKAVTLFGSLGDDVLRGQKGRDVIATGDGDDTILGLNGNDRICGGAGNDEIKGGRGKDRLAGQAGKDALNGGAGSGDVCKGGPKRDRGTKCEKGRI